jgi:hypothetical protein
MKNEQYKYLALVLTVIAMCLVWLVVKDITLGSNVLYAEPQQPAPASIQELTPEMIAIWKRWTLVGKDDDDFKLRFTEAIQAGYVPRFSVGRYDVLLMEKKK